MPKLLVPAAVIGLLEIARDDLQIDFPKPFPHHLPDQILQFVKLLIHLQDLPSFETNLANLANFKLATDQKTPLSKS